jgi:uncharacterized protein (TIGR03437 family)
MPYRLTTLLALTGLVAYSAVLSTPDQAAGPGQVVVASLAFSAEGQPISGLQFDLQWDDSLDLKLVIGGQLRGSSKILSTAPLGPRAIRCLFIGTNRDSLPDGELLQMFLAIDPGAEPRLAQVRFTNPVATDRDGNPASVRAEAAGIQIQSGNRISVALPSAGILNAASLLPGPVSPGEIIPLLGSLPQAAPLLLLFNGVPAPVLYAGLNQVNAIVPFGLDPDAPINLPIVLEVRTGNGSARVSVPIAPVAPALFTQNNTGTGPGAILNQDFTLNSPSNPAYRESIVMLYGTGFGMLDPQPADGQVVNGTAATRLVVTGSIAGIPAQVMYAGAAPGLLAGVVQVNLRVPADIAPVAAPVALPVTLVVGGVATPTGVTVSVW